MLKKYSYSNHQLSYIADRGLTDRGQGHFCIQENNRGGHDYCTGKLPSERTLNWHRLRLRGGQINQPWFERLERLRER